MDGSVVFARWLQCAPPCNTCFLGPPESTSETASRSVQPFSHSSPQRVPILHNGPPLSHQPSRLPIRMGDLGHLVHGTRFLGPNRVQLLVPSYQRSTIGRRAFPIAGARVWNALPSDVTPAPSLAVFGRRLKTELLRRCYNDV